eukprot:9484757-Pyramimonas_sp.AAC.1
MAASTAAVIFTEVPPSICAMRISSEAKCSSWASRGFCSCCMSSLVHTFESLLTMLRKSAMRGDSSQGGVSIWVAGER